MLINTTSNEKGWVQSAKVINLTFYKLLWLQKVSLEEKNILRQNKYHLRQTLHWICLQKGRHVQLFNYYSFEFKINW